MVFGGIDDGDITCVESFPGSFESIIDLIGGRKTACACLLDRMCWSERPRFPIAESGPPAPTTTTLYLSFTSETVA